MTKTEFEKWWQDIYQKFTKDNEAIVAFEDDERVIMLDTESGKTYIYNFAEALESHVNDPVINIAVAYAHLRDVEVPKIKEEPKFKRVGKGKEYYFVMKSPEGGMGTFNRKDDDCCIDENNFKNNNYFHTEERAEEVADKINFLLKLERLHDKYCPDYKTDWNNNREEKYCVYFDYDKNKYNFDFCTIWENKTQAYFPTEKIAQKVCDELNKDLEMPF